MWNYVALRLFWAIPTLFGVSIIMFSLLYVVPGDPLTGILPMFAGQDAREELRRELGLDRPLVVQYGSWLKKAVSGDLGRSVASRRPVTTEIADALKNTFLLAITAGVLTMILGTVFGTIAGFFQGRWPDKVVSAIAITGLSLPDYWTAMVLVIIFSVVWGVLPAQGMRTIGGDSGTAGCDKAHGRPRDCADDDSRGSSHPYGAGQHTGSPEPGICDRIAGQRHDALTPVVFHVMWSRTPHLQ